MCVGCVTVGVMLLPLFLRILLTLYQLEHQEADS
jgi:hypothetical protein